MPKVKPPKVQRELGTRIGRLRRKHEWSLRDLAELSGVAIASLSRLEKGQQVYTTLANLWALADAFEVTLDDLVGRTMA